jgi:hypothetical protein
MAIAIKGVPVLKKTAAIKFNNKARVAVSKKSSVKFSDQIEISSKILAKAKL